MGNAFYQFSNDKRIHSSTKLAIEGTFLYGVAMAGVQSLRHVLFDKMHSAFCLAALAPHLFSESSFRCVEWHMGFLCILLPLSYLQSFL